jgi:mercuric reductase
MEARRFDLVILGSGSTAFAAAIRAAELGKTAAMTENRTLGGTCVNRGCLPSKNLIAAANMIRDAAHPRYPGIQGALLRFNFSDLVRQKDEVISYYREKKYQSIVGRSDQCVQRFGAVRRAQRRSGGRCTSGS